MILYSQRVGDTGESIDHSRIEKSDTINRVFVLCTPINNDPGNPVDPV
jgi:hypothetical protein